MKLRPAAIALALLAAVALLLSGCGSKSGAAAVVGDTRITLSDVDSQVFELDEDALAISGFTTTASQVANGRSLVLTYSIRAEVTEQALGKLGLDPTDAELEAVHDDALGLLFNGFQLTGDAADVELRAQLEELGIRGAFYDTVIRFGEQLAIIIDDQNLAGTSDAGPRLGELGIDVRVSPRFGTWSFDTLTLDNVALPTFIATGAAG